MLHPSYTELMKVINGDSEEEKVISSRYSIVLATAKRARQLIAGDDAMVAGAAGKTDHRRRYAISRRKRWCKTIIYSC